MRKWTTIFFIFLLFNSFSQNSSDIELINNSNIQNNNNNNKANKSFVKHIFLFPLWIYKKVVSEQLSASCEFYPSCSVFCKESIILYGPIKGILLGADRLTRCHGAAHSENESYLKTKNDNKIENPPSFYSF